MFNGIAIKIENLTKTYHLYNSNLDRLKESIHPLRRKYHQEFNALHNINFEIKKGETIGIIGKNGSGKSTLLKLITGVLTPTAGSVMVNGKISALLELGSGFNPELTGIENVYFNGTLMGYSREEMDARLDDILAFADIGEFIYQPVKSYSSGMFVRLAFAVAINVDPEILIVDEALSVGDIFFQQKCYAIIRSKIDNGITCLFVSHDLSAVTNICKRGILIDNGEITFDGSPEEAASRYSAAIGQRIKGKTIDDIKPVLSVKEGNLIATAEEIEKKSIVPKRCQRHGAGGITILAVRATDHRGTDTLNVVMMEPLHLDVLVCANENVYNIHAGVHLYDRLGNLVFASGTRQLGVSLPDLQAEQKAIVRLSIKMNIQPGEYVFSVGVSEPSSEGPDVGYIHDRIDMLGPLLILSGNFTIQPFYGIALLPMEATYTIDTDEKESLCLLC